MAGTVKQPTLPLSLRRQIEMMIPLWLIKAISELPGSRQSKRRLDMYAIYRARKKHRKRLKVARSS